MERLVHTKVCLHCGKVFKAETKYCSDTCAKRTYKEHERTERIKQQQKDHLQLHHFPARPEIYQRHQSCPVTLIGVSRPSIYNLIAYDRLEAIRYGAHTVRIKLATINHTIASSKEQIKAVNNPPRQAGTHLHSRYFQAIKHLRGQVLPRRSANSTSRLRPSTNANTDSSL